MVCRKRWVDLLGICLRVFLKFKFLFLKGILGRWGINGICFWVGDL